VSASSLLKVDLDGTVVDTGSTDFTFNLAGFVIHSAVHASREDLRCVIHSHHRSVVGDGGYGRRQAALDGHGQGGRFRLRARVI